MKSFFTVLILSIIASTGFSQDVLNKVKSAAASQGVSAPSLPSLHDIPGAANAIMGQLGPALALTAAQKPTISNIVTGFLKQKAGILSLASTNKTAYDSKFSALQSSAFSKIKTALTVAQYTKFLNLKPSAPSASNVLSNLFY
ncbi:hypothetical protein ACFGVR_01130 [Mucilaginibacter sp. AW1-3]